MKIHTHPRVGRIRVATAALSPLICLIAFVIDVWWSPLLVFAVAVYVSTIALRYWLAVASCDCAVRVAKVHRHLDQAAGANSRISRALVEARAQNELLRQQVAALQQLSPRRESQQVARLTQTLKLMDSRLAWYEGRKVQGPKCDGCGHPTLTPETDKATVL